jgi:hypothetical protein
MTKTTYVAASLFGSGEEHSKAQELNCWPAIDASTSQEQEAIVLPEFNTRGDLGTHTAFAEHLSTMVKHLFLSLPITHSL